MTNDLKRVLIVEDERIVGEHIRISLKTHGYDAPYVLNSGEKALELLKTESFDLIYMDIMLDGELDGIETASLIKILCSYCVFNGL
jgi:DNA-binding response OmpR family regulator